MSNSTRLAFPPVLFLRLATVIAMAAVLHTMASPVDAQVRGDNPTYDVWAPRPATATLVVDAQEVGIDFSTAGQSGAYFRMDSGPVDAAAPDVVTLHFRTDVAVPWISFGIQDATGAWHFHFVYDVPTGESLIAIPVSELDIDPTQVTSYDAWVGAVDFDGQVYRLDGSFRFLLADPAVNVRAGDELDFLQTMQTPNIGEDPRVFYVHPEANLDTRLDIVGRVGDELHFLPGTEVVDEVQTLGSWREDRGVVNIVDCADLLITGLRARNTYQYTDMPVSGDEQSSTALNISRSENIRIQRAFLEGQGRCVMWVHGGSTVQVVDTTIDAYYFCVGVGASNVHFTNLIANQFNPLVTVDKHSTFWVSSSMRSTNNQLYENTVLEFLDTDINLQSGRAIVSGNGAYEAHSYVNFYGATRVNPTGYAQGKALGWVNFHKNYHAFTVSVMGDYLEPTKRLVQPTEDGEIGQFIVNTYQGGGRPSPLAPTAFCDDSGVCVTSDQVLGIDQPIDLVRGGLSADWIPIRPTRIAATDAGDMQVAYSADYEAVILNTAIRDVEMTEATHLRIRARSQRPGEYTARVSFVNQRNSQLNPRLLSITDQWQTYTIELSDYVRQNADKLIMVSHGNDQDLVLEVSEITILDAGT